MNLAAEPIKLPATENYYELGGIPICTTLPMPGIVRSAALNGGPLMNVREGPAAAYDALVEEIGERDLSKIYQMVGLRDGGTYIRWHTEFEFLISPDRHTILFRRLHGNTLEPALRSFLFGHVFSRALSDLGAEALHGTAAAVGGCAAAFLGNCGHGKSTLATWLLRSGLPLLTDDVLVLREDKDAVLAYPGLPQIKLLPDSVDDLFDLSHGVPICSCSPKLIFQLTSGHYAHPAPLRRIFVLGSPDDAPSDVKLEPIQGHSTIVALVSNVFNDDTVDPERQRRLFALLVRLTKTVPVIKLNYPRRRDVMPQVVSRIVEEMGREARQ